MARQIYTINATQVVTSVSHPEGVKSNVTGYPKDVDSRDYANEEVALIVAQADFADRVKQLTLADDRAMWKEPEEEPAPEGE